VAECQADLFDLALPTHEPSEPAGSGRLEPGAQWARADQLVHLDRLRHPLHRHRAQRSDLDVAFGEPQGIRGQERDSRPGELFHPRRQVRRLTHGAVVHPKVATDGADDDLPGV
jgi:hypothetical protein